jgi:hypothetical protein
MQKRNHEIFAMRFVALLMPAKFSYYDRWSTVLEKQIPLNFLQKQNHEIFAKRFIASLMLAKFSYYDRGVQFSQHKNNSAKFYAKTKSRNFCHALRGLAHVSQVLLLRQGSRDVALQK